MMGGRIAMAPSGVRELDASHEQCMSFLEILDEADDPELPVLLQKLVGQLHRYFARRGRLMRLSRFPAAALHEEAQRQLLAELLPFVRSAQRGRSALVRAYARTGLVAWLGQQLAGMDHALARHLEHSGWA